MMMIPEAKGHKIKIPAPGVSLLPHSYWPGSPHKSRKLYWK